MAKNIMDTKQLRDLDTGNEDYNFYYEEHQAVEELNGYPPRGVNGLSKADIMGVIIKLCDGEIEEMWVTDCIMPYDLSAKYYRVR